VPAYASAIPMRDFGRSGVKISAVGCSGQHLGDSEDQKISQQIVDGEIAVLDNCWECFSR
jgi:hypothetical protein